MRSWARVAVNWEMKRNETKKKSNEICKVRKRNPMKWNEICKVRKWNPTKWNEICKVRKRNPTKRLKWIDFQELKLIYSRTIIVLIKSYNHKVMNIFHQCSFLCSEKLVTSGSYLLWAPSIMKLFKQAFIYQLKYPALITAKTFLVQKILVTTCI